MPSQILKLGPEFKLHQALTFFLNVEGIVMADLSTSLWVVLGQSQSGTVWKLFSFFLPLEYYGFTV